MITRLNNNTKKYWLEWIKKRRDKNNPQILNSHNLYILPSGFGWAYAMLILILFVGAINYQINTIFLMAFLLTIIGLISAFEAHANLKNLSFKFISIEDSFQGTPAKLILFIHAHAKVRFGIEFEIPNQAKTRLPKIPANGLQFIIPIETNTRGYFTLPTIKISSFFPFGIFKVWSYAFFDEHYYVYPKMVDPGFWPDPYPAQHIKNKYASGDEEFYELKQVENPWFEPNLIAWKTAARGLGWYLKKMHSNEVDYWLFKLNDLVGKNIELKLQYLSYWLQTAELNGLVYALELNKTPTKFARGKDHLQYCLRQLALYQ